EPRRPAVPRCAAGHRGAADHARGRGAAVLRLRGEVHQPGHRAGAGAAQRRPAPGLGRAGCPLDRACPHGLRRPGSHRDRGARSHGAGAQPAAGRRPGPGRPRRRAGGPADPAPGRVERRASRRRRGGARGRPQDRPRPHARHRPAGPAGQRRGVGPPHDLRRPLRPARRAAGRRRGRRRDPRHVVHLHRHRLADRGAVRGRGRVARTGAGRGDTDPAAADDDHLPPALLRPPAPDRVRRADRHRRQVGRPAGRAGGTGGRRVRRRSRGL
ncbi:MAG: hypothetical protein AVDCRST_MAG07-2089, partial [uncultured Frankineae bacterium]